MTPADPVIERSKAVSPPARPDWWSSFTTWRYIGLFVFGNVVWSALFNLLIFKRSWGGVVSGYSGGLFVQFLIVEIVLLNRMIRRDDREVLRRPWVHVCFVTSLLALAGVLYFQP